MSGPEVRISKRTSPMVIEIKQEGTLESGNRRGNYFFVKSKENLGRAMQRKQK